MGLWHVAKLRRRRAGNRVVGKEITCPPPVLPIPPTAMRTRVHRCHVGKSAAPGNNDPLISGSQVRAFRPIFARVFAIGEGPELVRVLSFPSPLAPDKGATWAGR